MSTVTEKRQRSVKGLQWLLMMASTRMTRLRLASGPPNKKTSTSKSTGKHGSLQFVKRSSKPRNMPRKEKEKENLFFIFIMERMLASLAKYIPTHM